MQILSHQLCQPMCSDHCTKCFVSHHEVSTYLKHDWSCQQRQLHPRRKVCQLDQFNDTSFTCSDCHRNIQYTDSSLLALSYASETLAKGIALSLDRRPCFAASSFEEAAASGCKTVQRRKVMDKRGMHAMKDLLKYCGRGRGSQDPAFDLKMSPGRC